MAITITQSKSSLGILAGIEGSVPFISPAGALIEDNPNLFWDDVNNRLGIGTPTPGAKVEIAGQVKITGGTPGLDKVLTSDAVGLGTWKVASVDGTATFAQLSSNVDQEPTITTPVVVTYNVQDDIQGITHSTTVNPGEMTIDTDGVYFFLAQPQIGKDSGGSVQSFDMFLQIDRGSGFVDEANSNIRVSIRDNTGDEVTLLGFTVSLVTGNKLRLMQRVSSAAVGLGLKFTAAEVGPPSMPATPSIIFTMFRTGE